MRIATQEQAEALGLAAASTRWVKGEVEEARQQGTRIRRRMMLRGAFWWAEPMNQDAIKAARLEVTR